MNKLRITAALLVTTLLFGCATRGDVASVPRTAVWDVATANVGDQTYLFVNVVDNSNDAVEVWNIPDDGSSLSLIDRIVNGERGANNIDGVGGLATALIGSQTYLFVSNHQSAAWYYSDNDGNIKKSSVSVFSVADNGRLTFVDDIVDLERGANFLHGANDLETAIIGGQTYLFVAAKDDNAVSVFNVADNGRLTFVDDIVDGGRVANNLNRPSDLATAVIDGRTYLFVAAEDDDAVSVFNVADNGRLTFLEDVRDGEWGASNLGGASSVVTADIGDQTYLFVAAEDDDAVSIFIVTNDGELFFLGDGANNLGGAFDLETAVIGGQTYLFVSAVGNGDYDSTVSVFSVASDGSLTFLSDKRDTGAYQELATSIIGGQHYLFVDYANFYYDIEIDAVFGYRIRNSGLLVSVSEILY